MFMYSYCYVSSILYTLFNRAKWHYKYKIYMVKHNSINDLIKMY